LAQVLNWLKLPSFSFLAGEVVTFTPLHFSVFSFHSIFRSSLNFYLQLLFEAHTGSLHFLFRLTPEINHLNAISE